MKTYGHWTLIIALGFLALTGAGCETRRYTIDFEKHYPSAQHKQAERQDVHLQIEDAIPEEEYRKAQTFLGEDMTMFATNVFVIPMHHYAVYSADQPRTQLVGSVLQRQFSAAGLTASTRTGQTPGIAGNRHDPGLALSVRVKKMAVTTSFSSESSILPLIWTIIVTFPERQAEVLLDAQVMQPGSQTVLWKGTLSGSATRSEVDRMEETAKDAIKDPDAWMVQTAIDRAVSAMLTQSQAVQIAGRLRNDAFAKAMTLAQDTEASGNLRAALSQYGQAYRAAGDRTQTQTVIQTVAKTMRKLPTKPELPEDARRYGVQATTQAEQKHYDEALTLFGQSLEAAPWWAEGHFNRALLFANQERYQDAITNMQHFLVLAPNAPDARAAQDKIYEWELKAK